MLYKCYSWIKCGEPLVEDSVRLIERASTFVRADLLADSNGRFTAWVSFSLHWVGSDLRLNESIKTKEILKQNSLTEAVFKDYHTLLHPYYS